MNCVHTTSIRFDSMAGYTEAETKRAFEKALGFTTKPHTLQVKGTYIAIFIINSYLILY